MSLARGGARARAGRIPLVERQDCGWIVERIRKLGSDSEFLNERVVQFVKRQKPNHLQNQVELQEHYEKIQYAKVAQRRAMIVDDCGTSLEEIREIRATPGFPTYLQLPPPNQFQLNQIYKQVATEANLKFGRPYLLRNIKDRVQAWMRFEKSFENEQ